MFNSSVYSNRRNRLREQVGPGLILFPGNLESPMNYPGNPLHFRQDSSFLYFFGLDHPGLAGVVDTENDSDILFGDDVDVEDIIWMGDLPLFKDQAAEVGVTEVKPFADLEGYLKNAIRSGRKIYFLPPYRQGTMLQLSRWLGLRVEAIKDYLSPELIRAVVEQRSIKISQEIEQIELAVNVSRNMHTTAMRMASPGRLESEIAGVVEGIALSEGGMIAFPVILTMNGQTLHNHDHSSVLEKGRLMVNDSGAESAMHYAADITRTVPVGGKFTSRQKDIYELVLKAQMTAIDEIRPDRPYREVHLKAMTILASGLKDLGLMKGDVEEAVRKGAVALFMPHGLGHMMGLDVHDMENLGEDNVGYSGDCRRSDQFGLAYLRLARDLQPGFVLTVEPGLYFIPALIDKWIKEEKHLEFIAYDEVDRFRDFGGIRIEDDVLVTDSGRRVLGRPIPKTVAEIEEITATE